MCDVSRRTRLTSINPKNGSSEGNEGGTVGKIKNRRKQHESKDLGNIRVFVKSFGTTSLLSSGRYTPIVGTQRSRRLRSTSWTTLRERHPPFSCGHSLVVWSSNWDRHASRRGPLGPLWIGRGLEIPRLNRTGKSLSDRERPTLEVLVSIFLLGTYHKRKGSKSSRCLVIVTECTMRVFVWGEPKPSVWKTFW